MGEEADLDALVAKPTCSLDDIISFIEDAMDANGCAHVTVEGATWYVDRK